VNQRVRHVRICRWSRPRCFGGREVHNDRLALPPPEESRSTIGIQREAFAALSQPAGFSQIHWWDRLLENGSCLDGTLRLKDRVTSLLKYIFQRFCGLRFASRLPAAIVCYVLGASSEFVF